MFSLKNLSIFNIFLNYLRLIFFPGISINGTGADGVLDAAVVEAHYELLIFLRMVRGLAYQVLAGAVLLVVLAHSEVVFI